MPSTIDNYNDFSLTTAASSHVADRALKPFLASSFDPADYLNATLPPLSQQQTTRQHGSVPLSELSTQTQTLLSQLNAYLIRLSTILTQLTDDILRCGGRLGYEVELLRGDTISFSDSLTEGLRGSIQQFVPNGLTLHVQDTTTTSREPDAEEGTLASVVNDAESVSAPNQPDYITQLRTLTLVRARLESVIKVFGEAMEWVLPPSEVSLKSSFISVSAPDAGPDRPSREEKGKEYAKKVRSEVVDLVNEDSLEAALARIQAFRDLAQVWKGTAEEKARFKFVEGLIQLVEERQRALGRNSRDNPRFPDKTTPTGHPTERDQHRDAGSDGGYGFLESLQKMRAGLSLD